MDLDRTMTKLNGAIVWLLRSPLHALLDPGLMLIMVTGRRSGRSYTIPVGYQRDGDRVVVLVSKARRKNWWRNYLEPGPIGLRLGGEDLRGNARVLPPASEPFLAAIDGTLRRMPWLGRQFGIRYSRRSGLGTAQRELLAREVAVVEITIG